MNITTRNARIETSDSFDGRLILEVSTNVNGYGVEIEWCSLEHGALYICTREDRPNRLFIVGVPSEKWVGDMEGCGYTIVRQIEPPNAVLTGAGPDAKP